MARGAAAGVAVSGLVAVCLVALVLLWRMGKWAEAMARRERVSAAWLDSQCAAEGRAGWEGPRWRFPAERDAINRRDRLARIAAVRSGQKRWVS